MSTRAKELKLVVVFFFSFFDLKCLRLKCKQDESRRPQQRACGSFHCSLNQLLYTLIIQPLSTRAGHRDALQQRTPTQHAQLIYCFRQAELIHDCKRAASWTHQQLAKKRKFMASDAASKGNAEAMNPNLIIVSLLDGKIRAVNTNYRHF